MKYLFKTNGNTVYRREKAGRAGGRREDHPRGRVAF